MKQNVKEQRHNRLLTIASTANIAPAIYTLRSLPQFLNKDLYNLIAI